MILALVSYGTFAQNPVQSPTPNWVEEVSYSTETVEEEDQSGYYYLLSDKQINTLTDVFYSRTVVKVLNSEGISQLSDLTFEFDPEYERLVFHQIDVIRNGEQINKLDLSTIQTVQRESNLERKLYDGRLTSIVNLLDIREGDILVYAYSIKGNNPVYEGKYSYVFNFQYGIPFGEIRYRLITDKNEVPQFDYKNGVSRPEIKEVGNTSIYQWSIKDISAKFYDNNTPAWYDDDPKVYVSTHGSWEDIVKEHSKLYKLTSREKEKLAKLANQNLPFSTEVKQSKEKQITSLINFVQDDIRYFGFENGLSSHKPESPLKVLNQRYGDCKGKSLLLVELLGNIGVEAYPMLVNTSTGENLDEEIPSPNRFNHCVVNYFHEGEVFYVDPTISNQGGDMQKRSFPNYKKGLVLRPGETNLTTIPYNEENGIEIQEVYDVEAINGGGSFSVVTTYKGSNADAMRADFAQRSNGSIQKDYLQFYSILFPTIKVQEKITIEDSRDFNNQFIVNEYYEIDSLWQKSPENEKLLYLEIYPLALENYVSTVKSPARTSPYYTGYPASISYDISVNLPEEWGVEPLETRIDSDYFAYTNEVDSYLNKILISYSYDRKATFVPAKDVAKYIEQQGSVLDDLSYYITYDLGLARSADNSGLSWIAVLLTILTLILAGYGAYVLYFRYDVAPKVKDVNAKPIGGWLILVAIGLVLSPIILMAGLITDDGYFDAYTWSTLWNTEEVNGKAYIVLIAFELIINIVRVVFCVIVIILFFERRSIVPRLMVILYAGTLGFIVFDAIVAYSIDSSVFTSADDYETTKEIIGSIFRAAIWIPYFMISDRVKHTFVKRAKNYKPPIVETESIINTSYSGEDIIRRE